MKHELVKGTQFGVRVRKTDDKKKVVLLKIVLLLKKKSVDVIKYFTVWE